MINDRPPVATITNQHIYSLSKKKTIYTAITSTTTGITVILFCWLFITNVMAIKNVVTPMNVNVCLFFCMYCIDRVCVVTLMRKKWFECMKTIGISVTRFTKREPRQKSRCTLKDNDQEGVNHATYNQKICEKAKANENMDVIRDIPTKIHFKKIVRKKNTEKKRKSFLLVV